MSKSRPTSWYHFLLLGTLLSGCLPSSCNRTEPRDVFPADSLSRQHAGTVSVDTLLVLTGIDPSEEFPMEYPRTIQFDNQGHLWIADTEIHQLAAVNDDGELVEHVDAAAFKFPYIAGFQGDTLVAFSAGTSEIINIADSEAVGRIPVPDDAPARGVFRYVSADDDHIYLKVIAEDYTGYIASIDREGSVLDRWVLNGPYWQYTGLLRKWGSSLVSLSGYRPVIHIAESDQSIQTIQLMGFDSPMLSRSRQFVLGEQAVPPLLSASAVAVDERLFVLNMRPGWLRVDVYNDTGLLTHVLTQPSPEFNQNYYPTDIAAKRIGEREYELAVAVIEPEPRIERYRWTLR